jgi:hypothetical protein
LAALAAAKKKKDAAIAAALRLKEEIACAKKMPLATLETALNLRHPK